MKQDWIFRNQRVRSLLQTTFCVFMDTYIDLFIVLNTFIVADELYYVCAGSLVKTKINVDENMKSINKRQTASVD